MSKHREEEHEEEGGSERYLITYSDLMTLLLALFIILYSIAQVDAKKFNAVASQFRDQMGTVVNGGAGEGLGPGEGPGADTDISGIEGAGENALDQIYKVLQDYVAANNLSAQIALENTDNYVKIHIKDTLMFVPDSPQLLPESRPIIENIGKAIAQVYNNVDYITFSGHTADVGSDSIASDQTSWRLSTERAITVLNDFIGYGLPQSKLSIQGFAHFDPVAENDTAEGRAQNRRVEITIYKYPTEDKGQFQQDIARHTSEG